jgi:hypothetical protein
MAPYGLWDAVGVFGQAEGLAVDRSGNVVILGSGDAVTVFGSNAIQPRTPESYPDAPYASYVVKYDTSLQNVLWGTYFGDDPSSNPQFPSRGGIAMDSSGNVWLSGSSRISKLPGSNSSSTQVSAYVGEISADGSSLLSLSLTRSLGGDAITCKPGGVAVLGGTDSFLLSSPLDRVYMVANSANSVSSGTIAPAELVSLF